MVLDNVNDLILELASRRQAAKAFGDVAYGTSSEFRKDPRVIAAKVKKGHEALTNMGIAKQAESAIRALATDPKKTMRGALRGLADGAVANITSNLDPSGSIGGFDPANINMRNAASSIRRVADNPMEYGKKAIAGVTKGVDHLRRDFQEAPVRTTLGTTGNIAKAWWNFMAGPTSVVYKPILGALSTTSDERALMARQLQREEFRKARNAHNDEQRAYYDPMIPPPKK